MTGPFSGNYWLDSLCYHGAMSVIVCAFFWYVFGASSWWLVTAAILGPMAGFINWLVDRNFQ